MKMLGHEEYNVKRRYKARDRNALRSKRRALLDRRPDLHQRKWAVHQVLKHGRTQRYVAGFMGVHPSTLSRWVKAYKKAGVEGLRYKSHRPHTIRTLPAEVVEAILEARKDRGEGCERIAAKLRIACHTSVWRVLRRFGILPSKKRIRRRWRHFERKHPNSMWQIDIKTVSQSPPAYTISILDDHSRFIVGCEVYDHVPTVDDVVGLLERAIRIYGPPREVLTDHGAQFWCNKAPGVSTFDLWLDEHRIKHILAGVRKPTTIGKVERWHRTLKEELIEKVGTIEEFVRELPGFIRYYNYERPHFGYVRTKISEQVWHRKKIVYIPAERFRPVLEARGLIG